jgi:hypothetical protein
MRSAATNEEINRIGINSPVRVDKNSQPAAPIQIGVGATDFQWLDATLVSGPNLAPRFD